MSNPSDQAKVVKSFIDGTLPLKSAQSKLGKSRATIYRYAKMVQEGKPIEDRRKYGNHRKYGKSA